MVAASIQRSRGTGLTDEIYRTTTNKHHQHNIIKQQTAHVIATISSARRNMDFIDYDTFQSSAEEASALPEPAPPLLLPITPNLKARFKGLSLLKKTTPSQPEQSTGESDVSHLQDNDAASTTQTAQKYAQMSLKLLEESDINSTNSTGLLSDLPNKATLNDHFTKSTGSKPDQFLSSKLATVLNNYTGNESSLRDALSILQQKQDIDLQALIRSDMLGSIHRRRFRSQIEGELLKEHTAVLREFQPVVQKVENLGQRIRKLNELNEELNANHSIDPAVLNEIEDLSTQKNLLVLKKSVLNSFKKSFTLTQYEEHYLSNEDISMEYFQILYKCKTIHNNCSILLTLQNPSLGMKIMEKMTKFLELSYQRISFFLSTQLERSMSDGSRYTDNNNASTNPTEDLRLMKLSIFYLSTNLKYFDEITNKLIQSRSKTIVDDFLYQSNNADSIDNSRPIILSAHDPLRYIGDILAFVHSTIVNEVELITNLFEIGESTQTDREYERSEFEKNLIKLENLEDVNRSVKSTIAKIIGALSRPLKMRVEQIVRSEKRLDVVQKVFGLLDLYHLMFAKQLKESSDCSILDTLDSLKSLCVERIFGVLNEMIHFKGKELETTHWALDDDDSLLPPDWLRELLSETLVIFEDGSNMGTDSKVLNLDDETFKSLCALLIEKPLELVNKQAEKNFKPHKVALLIYRLNCLDLIISKIVQFPQLSKEVDSLNDKVKEDDRELTLEQFNLLVQDAGLQIHQQLIQLVFPIEQIEDEDDYEMYRSLIENKLFGKPKLLEIEMQLHEFLPQALVDIQQAVFNISSPSIANSVISGSSLKFLQLYDVFYRIVNMLYEDEEQEEGVEKTTILEFTTHDVATLLGVEESYKL